MHLRLSKKNLFDNALLLLIYLQLVILEFFGFSNILNKIVCILILLRVVCFPGRQIRRVLIEGCVLAFIYLVGAVFGDVLNWGYVYSNSLMIIYSLIYAYYIAFLAKNRPEYLDSVLSKCFWLFNITLIVNMVVIYIQIINPYSIQGVTDTVIDYYEDSISGLFMYASTHNICLFTTAVTLYDLSYKGKLSSKMKRYLINILTVVVIIISFALSLFNDNKAFFILLPIVFVIYWFADAKRTKSQFSNRLLMVCLVPVVFILVYYMVPSFSAFIDDNILSVFEMANTALTLGNSAAGSNERIAILLYALQKGSTWLTGMGFGSTTIYSNYFEGFQHFGQADLGSFLVLGGIWFFVVLLSMYLYMFKIIVGVNKKDKRFTIAILVVVILVCTYTQCFSRTNTMICLTLIMLSFRVRFCATEEVQLKGPADVVKNEGCLIEGERE